MKDVRTKQIHSTLAFLRSVILSGEPMTEEIRKSINMAIENLKSLDAILEMYKED